MLLLIVKTLCISRTVPTLLCVFDICPPVLWCYTQYPPGQIKSLILLSHISMINLCLYTHQLLYWAHLSSKRLRLVLPSELPCFFVAHFHQSVGNIPRHLFPYWPENITDAVNWISLFTLWTAETRSWRHFWQSPELRTSVVLGFRVLEDCLGEPWMPR